MRNKLAIGFGMKSLTKPYFRLIISLYAPVMNYNIIDGLFSPETSHIQLLFYLSFFGRC